MRHKDVVVDVDPARQQCTSVVVSHGASADGSGMTSHTNDCENCDFRLSRVAAGDWEAGAAWPAYVFHTAYPKEVSERSFTWSAANLETGVDEALEAAWRKMPMDVPIGHIPQVAHTYALFEGSYGIMNEKMVAFGESTCGAALRAAPKGSSWRCGDDDAPLCDGEALLDIGMLSRLGLERCGTARCAIETMGALAEVHGYYSAAFDDEDAAAFSEAGEALTVADATETWMFHVLADDSGRGAVWAAQRVPDGHVSVVANMFVIREIDPKGRGSDFLYSSNIFDVAERTNLRVDGPTGKLDFLATYGPVPGYAPWDRRIWRVFNLLGDPAVVGDLPSAVDWTAHPYQMPFSVPVAEKVTVAKFLTVQRDHYEGTDFDQTVGLLAGPYGSPERFDGARANKDRPGGRPDDDRDLAPASRKGNFERSISIHRTATNSITQSRPHLPDEVGALLWWGVYAPAAATYAPLYVAVSDVPQSYTRGTLHKFDDRAAWWAFAAVGNYVSRFYKFMIPLVQEAQASIEARAFQEIVKTEAAAVEALKKGETKEALETLSAFSHAHAARILDAWHALFATLMTRFHDGYDFDVTLPIPKVTAGLFYPGWWLELGGYFANSDPKGRAIDYATFNKPTTFDGDSRVVLLDRRDDDENIDDATNVGYDWQVDDDAAAPGALSEAARAVALLLVGFAAGFAAHAAKRANGRVDPAYSTVTVTLPSPKGGPRAVRPTTTYGAGSTV